MFKGLGALGDLAGMMQQAQQMGANLKEVKERLASQRFTGEAGGGMVKVEVSGSQQVLSVTIDPGLVERGEREMIEDLTVTAINEAGAKARAADAEAMQELAGGLGNIPGVGDMLSKFTGGGQS